MNSNTVVELSNCNYIPYRKVISIIIRWFTNIDQIVHKYYSHIIADTKRLDDDMEYIKFYIEEDMNSFSNKITDKLNKFKDKLDEYILTLISDECDKNLNIFKKLLKDILDYYDKIVSRFEYFMSDKYILYNNSEEFIKKKIFENISKKIDKLEKYFQNKDNLKHFQISTNEYFSGIKDETVEKYFKNLNDEEKIKLKFFVHVLIIIKGFRNNIKNYEKYDNEFINKFIRHIYHKILIFKIMRKK